MTELKDFCGILMGQSPFDSMPDPSANWEGFLRRLDHWLKKKDEAPDQWVSTDHIELDGMQPEELSDINRVRSLVC